MCGIGGYSSSNPEINGAQELSEAMFFLRHRGDAATGMSTMTQDGRFDGHSGAGRADTVYTPEVLTRIAGQTAIAHNLWSTDTVDPVMQPIWSEDTQFAFVHNGQLSEMTELRAYVESFHIDTIYFNDSQLAARAIELAFLAGKKKSLPDAVRKIYPMLNGGFACVAMQGDTVVAFRDPGGLRPLELAEIEDGYMVASETFAFHPSGARYKREVKGGEMIILEGGELDKEKLAKFVPKRDPFESIYIADRNSIKHGMSVDHIRRRLGAQLARQFALKDKEYLVTPVPETAIPIAETYADKLGHQYKSVLTRYRFRDRRSFQQRGRSEQRSTVKGKIQLVPGSVQGRHVIVVEDSFVRFTTSPEINDMLEEGGAESVTFVAGSPPIGYPDHTGVDTRAQNDLPASYMTPEQLRRFVGCDRLGYLAVSRLLKALRQPADKLNMSVFDGIYPYDIGEHAKNIKPAVSKDYLENAYAEA